MHGAAGLGCLSSRQLSCRAGKRAWHDRASALRLLRRRTPPAYGQACTCKEQLELPAALPAWQLWLWCVGRRARGQAGVESQGTALKRQMRKLRIATITQHIHVSKGAGFANVAEQSDPNPRLRFRVYMIFHIVETRQMVVLYHDAVAATPWRTLRVERLSHAWRIEKRELIPIAG